MISLNSSPLLGLVASARLPLPWPCTTHLETSLIAGHPSSIAEVPSPDGSEKPYQAVSQPAG
jgi:hypothetical protein